MTTEDTDTHGHHVHLHLSRGHLLEDIHAGINNLREMKQGLPSAKATATDFGHWLHQKVAFISRTAQRTFIQASESRQLWRKRLGRFLESKEVHIVLIILLLVDLVAVVTDILESLHSKAEQIDECVELLTLCKEAAASCEEFHREELSEIPFYISLVVLSILLLNLALLFVAWGGAFFLHPGYVLDLLVVTTAIILETTFDSDTAGLLAVLTLWRLVRVMHGIFEVTDEHFEAELHKLEGLIKTLQEQHEHDKETLQSTQQQLLEVSEHCDGALSKEPEE